MSKPVKPIFIVGINDPLTPEHFQQTQDMMAEKFSDYHVLIYQDESLPELRFEVFYEKDFNEVKYDELKALVKERIKEVEEVDDDEDNGHSSI